MLVFLDIDGVMVPAQGWKRPEIMEDGFPAFSQRAVYVIQKLVSDHIAIVLTTSHKSKFTLEEWKDIFRNRGIAIRQLFSLPDSPSNRNRKDEILDWVASHGLKEPFVILDDDKSLNELPKDLKESLVQTDSHIGLTENHLPIIEAILKKDTRFA